MSESRILAEIEAAASHYRICVLPRNPKKLYCSVWAMPDQQYHAGVIWRTNTGAARMGNRFVRFGLPGMPDFEGWLFKSGLRLSIEAKAGIAKETPDQRSYAILARSTGVLHAVCRSYGDATAIFSIWHSQGSL